MAASLIAFSGVTKVRFTAAPEGEKKKKLALKTESSFPFSTCTKTYPATIITTSECKELTVQLIYTQTRHIFSLIELK